METKFCVPVVVNNIRVITYFTTNLAITLIRQSVAKALRCAGIDPRTIIIDGDEHTNPLFPVPGDEKELYQKLVWATGLGVSLASPTYASKIRNIDRTELIPKLKELIIGIDAIHFFSDGGPAHYKNKSNFANLSFFEKEYSMKVRWNFWASGHGKNACDGIGGSTKRQFRLASLRGEMLITCQQLLEWAESNIPAVTYMLISKEVVKTNSLCILPRIEAAQMIKGTRQFHCFIPGPQGVLFASELCNSSLPSKKFVVVKSSFVPIDLSTISIGDFLVVYRAS
ncbi:hypothetical protein DAPPUDRAFT_109754 [Daphnia pulex]|uniref:Uncharacterized protein n=1 Tax=Daphnia pulex TaxID=6669 RepID=E9H432_DAPPU|nr:hypothetical protein DAPPUDRAFT_109754 [Daphnia pulex]|eukprot:EFX73443.1 hypothetical protein DAPPUDRAFT_109754 [Daphnia pulex]